jgi:FecR-like protein
MGRIGQRGRACTRVLLSTAVFFFWLAGRHTQAQDVGEVVWADPNVELERQQERLTAIPTTPLRVGDKLFTKKPGAARLLFYGDVAGKMKTGLSEALNYLNVGDDSLATITQYDYLPGGPKARFVLDRGTAYALFAYASGGAQYEITTPTAVAIARGTAFVVTYDLASETTEIVCLSGQVDVRGLARREENVPVSARQMRTIPKGGRPSAAEIVPEQRLREALAGIEFIGDGRGEGLDGPTRFGQSLPIPDQFTLVRQPHTGAGGPCPWPGVTCKTGEPLGGKGNLDVQF